MALEKKQLNLINEMIASPYENITEVCKRVGVPRSTYYNWKSNPEFEAEKEKRLNELWRDFEPIAQAQMRKHCLSENEAISLQATKYILDSLGMSAPLKIEADVEQKVIKVTIDD